ncbi:MAG: hydroxylamine oxidoreductase [Planctomycetes bacterium]|nr:hydroxylamine oxidoreductase [Planctomycetota bacterium]
MEVARRRVEAGLAPPEAQVPAASRACVECHAQTTPGIVDHWRGSTHAAKGVACVECHQASPLDADGFDHYGAHVATVATPRDCARCHPVEAGEFQRSHHAAAGDILASLDNYLAETVEGSRVPFDPHGATPGRPGGGPVNGMASAFLGCQQCHGSRVAFQALDGGRVGVEELRPDAEGRPTNAEAVARVRRDGGGRPLFDPGTWPNTGIGRLNLDGTRGSCFACHSRHDFSPRRARQPENCGRCHLGPDHPQSEIYEESKHGVAYRDLRDSLRLDGPTWVLGRDYSQAPTCATCHMSGHSRNGGRVTHDPGERISWTNRPPVSLVLDTDVQGRVVTEGDLARRAALVADTAEAKRGRMKAVCGHCHTGDYVDAFYRQYDDLVILYNEKFARPGVAILQALQTGGLVSARQFDEEIEWTWFYLWHHEGRRARHGAAMMAPDYTHWHGMYEVAERFYMGLVPQARGLIRAAEEEGRGEAARAAREVLDGILARPEHAWFGR